jgi:NAD-dependent dihydropyrimidine dehydrogenase PreA subunit
MTKIKFQIEDCKKCGICVNACPKYCFKITDKMNADFSKCCVCRACVASCPFGLMEVVEDESRD